jgi:hypothetical protein
MQRQWLEWVERHRIVAISALNSMVIVTFALLIALMTSDSDSKEAHALAERASAANAAARQASEKTKSREVRQPSRSAVRRTPPNVAGQPSAGDARESGQLRGSSFRVSNSAPRRTRVRVNENALPLPRGIETADDYGPWHAQQSGADVLAPLPRGHPLRREDD